MTEQEEFEFRHRLESELAAQPAKPTAQATSLTTTDKVLRGMRDPIDGGAQLLTHVLPDSVVNAGNKFNNWLADKTGLVAKLPERNLSSLVTGQKTGVDGLIQQEESKYQAARSAQGETGIDGARLVGNVLSPANLALGGAAGVAAPASMVGRIGVGAASGAASNALAPVTEGNFVDEKLNQLGIGGGIGAALPIVGSGLARIINPNTSDAVKKMLAEKITPTAGQILGGGWQRLEDKLTSVPLLGDAISSARAKGLDEFNRAAYAKALTPIDGVIPSTVGREGVASVKNQLGDAYNALLPKLTFQPDAQFAQELGSLRSMAQNLAPQEARKFESLLNEHLSKISPNGGMTGETFKIVEGALNKDVGRFSRSLDPYQQELGDALKQTLQTFRDGLSRSNPNYAGELGKINQGYANYARIRDAASRQGSLDGKFTPSQYSAAVRAQDKTVGKGGFATGNALGQDLSDAGKTVLNSQYPDSGTTGRLLAGLLTGGAAAGAATVNPLAVSMGALSAAPYLPGGRQLAAALLARRPDMAQPVADAVRKFSPALTVGVTPSLDGRN